MKLDADTSEGDLELQIKLLISWLASDAGIEATIIEVRQKLRELRQLRDHLALVRFLNTRPRVLDNPRSRSWHQ